MIETKTPKLASSMRLLCHVRMFKPQFAPLVEAGTKCQTVRPKPKRMPKPGDRISLRMWTGKPYRSKQRVLRESEIVAVERITISDTGHELLVCVGNKSLTPEELNAFSIADGFKGGIEMFNWFEATHGLPFEGIIIKWE
ncbi:MAG: ASCH domain-containing protein [Actinomycetes bacterium]